MSIKRFERIRTDNADLNKLQDNLEPSLNQIKQALDSEIVSGVSLQSGRLNTIGHKLGRNLIGWEVIRQFGRADIWEEVSNASPGLVVLLRCSADVVVSLKFT